MGEDRIVFGAGITADDITASRSGDNLVIKINDPNDPSATDQITIENWNNKMYRIERFLFADGTVLTATDLSNRAMTGTAGNDTITLWSDSAFVDGKSGDDKITSSAANVTILGGDGDDTITVSGNNNTVDGGSGNDTITFNYYANNTIDGGDGDDLIKVIDNRYSNAGYANTFVGGKGNDRIQSGASADTYLFNRGDGQDTINDYGYNSYGYVAGKDQIVFGADINADQLWFQRVGNNLEIKVIGTEEKITIENWYSSSIYHIEQFQTADGQILLDTQVDALVQAMASFAPPVSGQTSLPPNVQNTLNAVIAANWK